MLFLIRLCRSQCPRSVSKLSFCWSCCFLLVAARQLVSFVFVSIKRLHFVECFVKLLSNELSERKHFDFKQSILHCLLYVLPIWMYFLFIDDVILLICIWAMGSNHNELYVQSGSGKKTSGSVVLVPTYYLFISYYCLCFLMFLFIIFYFGIEIWSTYNWKLSSVRFAW